MLQWLRRFIPTRRKPRCCECGGRGRPLMRWTARLWVCCYCYESHGYDSYFEWNPTLYAEQPKSKL